MDKLEKNKSYIIIGVIILLILTVFITKKLSTNTLNDCSDPNCLDHKEEAIIKTYKVYNFGSRICSACRQMEPIYEKIKEEYKSSINFEYIDVDDEKNIKLCYTYGIAYTPTFVIVDENGTKVDKLIGYVPEDEFRQFIDKWENK